MDRKIWKRLFFCLEFCLCPGILRIWILKTGTRQLPVTSSVARKEEFIYINMHQPQHVQTIRAQTVGSTHLKSMHVVRKRKSSGQWSLSSCNGFRIVPNERVGVKGPGAGLALAGAHRPAAQMNYPDNVSVYLLRVERQWGLDFTCLFRPWHSPMPPTPQPTVVLFLRLTHSNYESLNLHRQKITPPCSAARAGGMAYPRLFSIYSWFRSLQLIWGKRYFLGLFDWLWRY